MSWRKVIKDRRRKKLHFALFSYFVPESPLCTCNHTLMSYQPAFYEYCAKVQTKTTWHGNVN